MISWSRLRTAVRPQIRDGFRSRQGRSRLGAGCAMLCRATLYGVLVGCLVAADAGASEYKISAGDVLALTVTGVPDLNTRAPVDADGEVILPLIGALPVAGLSLLEATAKIRTELPTKQLDRRLDDGRAVPVIVMPGQIGVSIAEYRPVYISGDVAKPGEIMFRPGLTVRQAVALAGGFDLIRFKLDNPVMQMSDLSGSAKHLWIEYAKDVAAIARLRAQLDGKEQLDATGLNEVPISKALASDVLANEQAQLAAQNEDFSKEKVYLSSATQKEVQRAGILHEQEVKQVDALAMDTADLQRYEDLFKKGAVALPSVSEARRTVLGSSTRALETTAALASVEREQGDIARRLERLSNNRHIKLLSDIQEATTKLASTKAMLQAVSNKLRFAGAVKSQLVHGFDDSVRVNITRASDAGPQQIVGQPDAKLEPGDVVEVVITASDPITQSP